MYILRLKLYKKEGKGQMSLRTDLALEAKTEISGGENGIIKEIKENENIKTTVIKVVSDEGERLINKPQGTYITVEFGDIISTADFTPLKSEIKRVLSELLSVNGTVLVAGLGNNDITPDAVGPLTAGGILATRHIAGAFAESIGLKGLKSVAVITPDVLGKTGIETAELIRGTADKIKPAAVIAVDALAARDPNRLFKTVQLTNSGISPGSGVKNRRGEISEKIIGVPVIAVGVPTVTDAEAIAYSLTGTEPETDSGMFVTPKEVDMLCGKISKILSETLNEFLQPEIDADIIEGLV